MAALTSTPGAGPWKRRMLAPGVPLAPQALPAPAGDEVQPPPIDPVRIIAGSPQVARTLGAELAFPEGAGAGPVPLAQRAPQDMDATPPRLASAEEAAAYNPHCTGPRPSFLATWPGAGDCGELNRFIGARIWPGDGEPFPGMVMVQQSAGATSATLPLVTLNVMQCSVFLLRADDGEALMIHHDSGLRSTWNDSIQQICGRPRSPATPRRRLLGRDRMNFEAFMNKPGRKQLLVVGSDRSNDRREEMRWIAARGVEVLEPIFVRTPDHGGDDDQALCNVSYRPLKDELVVHLWDYSDQDQSKVMYFERAFTGGARPWTGLAEGEGDIVDRYEEYEAVLDSRRLDANAAAILRQCLDVIGLRAFDRPRAAAALRALTGSDDVPPEIRTVLRSANGRPTARSALVGLTLLAAHAARGGRQGE